MQNKGFVKVFAVLLTLVCVFYLSFSFVTRHYTNKAKEIANGDPKVEQDYLDSLSNEKVMLWNWTLKDCREMEISLGLDLKGGMNVILEVSVPDVIRALADNKPDENFNKALNEAAKQAVNSQDDIITLFVREYQKTAPGAKLSELFATQQLKDKVNQKSSDAEVEKVLRAEVKAAVENSYNVLRTRIDRFGVVQPNIQSLEDKMGRIMVELPGIKEPERVRKLLQGSANLEFWETYTAKEILPAMQSADSKLRAILSQETAADSTATNTTADTIPAAKLTEATPAKKAVSVADSLAATLKGDAKDEKAGANMEEIKKQYPLLAILQLNSSGQGPVIGYANYKDTADINRYLSMPEIQSELPKDLRLKWGVSPSEFDKKGQTFELYAIKSTERNGKAPLEGDVVTDAKDEFDQYSKPAVSMTMNSDGARRWAQLTKQNIGRSIAIVLDNYVYSAPNVNSEITGGRSQITGHFTPEQAKDLANVLKSGKMPAPAHIVQEDIVGPSLGQESINAGIFSFVVALILLMIYMCSMYGFIPGMVANCALFLNFFFTLGILSSFQAALTMSGIAGMVLSLGMAVDANVLIYERTKEELRAGKGVKKALADGYSNAFSAILDNQRKRKMKKNILFALISLCFWGCSEDEIKPYHGGQYLYFSQLKEFGDEDFEVSFNNYPTSDAIIVKIGLGLVGKPFSTDTPYEVSVVAEDESEDKIKNADQKNYHLPDNPMFKAGLSNDTLEVVLLKTEDLKENVKLCLKILPNEYFEGSIPEYEQIKIVFNNIISKPLWWTNDVTKLYLGTYSRKKYEEFVKCTNISDFGKLSTAEKRQYALTFKYYIAVNNVMDKNDTTGEEFPMTVPIN